MYSSGTIKQDLSFTSQPELDDTPLLGNEDIGKYCMLIGSLQWAKTSCRFDISYATNTLSRYTAAPREGHLAAACKVVGYLKHYSKGRIMFDTCDFDLPDCAV